MSTGAQELVKLREALGPLAEEAEPTGSCPEPETIWAAVQGDLPAGEIRAVVDHVGSCLVCAEAWEVADDMVASRDRIETADPSTAAASGLRQHWWLSAAVAALILLVAGVQWLPREEWRWGPGYRGSDATSIRSLLPVERPLAREVCLLRWEGPDGAESYNLRVTWVTAEHRQVVVEVEGLEAPEFRVPEGRLSELPSGAKLIWSVEALRNERTLATRSFDSRID